MRGQHPHKIELDEAQDYHLGFKATQRPAPGWSGLCVCCCTYVPCEYTDRNGDDWCAACHDSGFCDKGDVCGRPRALVIYPGLDPDNREIAWERTCPTCGSMPRQPCRMSVSTFTSNFHPERYAIDPDLDVDTQAAIDSILGKEPMT